MQTDERTGPVADAALPRPRFFGRRAWYRRRVQLLEQQAVLDELTGLRNQRALWRELDRRAATCSEASPLTVVMLDFDLFAEVNGRYGHAVGDAVLERAAAVLREAGLQRPAFRYGGEEFVILVAGDEDDGRELAERMRGEIARLNGQLPAVTISCGVAELQGPAEPWAALDRADAALREAKRAGRNRVVVAGRTERTTAEYLVDEPEHETARRAALALAVATLEVRDRSTADHADDVLTLCEALGRELGFEGRELERLMAGAQLHDVGKVAVSSAILNKPGPLNDDEWAVMREHTVIGERILRSVPEMAEVAMIVRHSHERWDGLGYPDGLSGDSIPLASRVILCADAFHAMRSNRPYRAGCPATEALEELHACAGTQFDPTVVAALARVVEQARASRLTGTSSRRRKRLVLLLTTLALAGTAIAAVPELRDAVGSVFGVTTPAPRAPSAEEPASDPSSATRADRPPPPSPPRTTETRTRSRSRSSSDGAATRRSRSRRGAGRRAGQLGAGPAKRTRGSDRARRAAPGTPTGADTRAATGTGTGTRTGTGGGTGTRTGTGTSNGTSTGTGTGTHSTSGKLAGPGVYCRGESKRKARGQARSDFSACVRAQAHREARRKDRRKR